MAIKKIAAATPGRLTIQAGKQPPRPGSKGGAGLLPGPAPAPDADTEPPIIVQGGGSIDMNVPPRFRDHGTGSHGKKFKDAAGTLESVVIDDTTTIKLKPDSRIEIRYK